MLWRDLREFISHLERTGDLKVVKGANWEEEIGGITELMTEENGPGLLFDDVHGYPSGFRVASNLFTTAARTALAVGLDPKSPKLSKEWRTLIDNLKPIPVEASNDAPVLENKMLGEDIDLFKFPVPKWHERDGGRYIGTGVCVINKSLSTDVVNVGAYRVAVMDRNTCSIFIEPGKHGYQNAQEYWKRGEKCPVVLSVGQDPILTSLAGPTIFHTPRDISEFEVAGYIHKSPYPVVYGEKTGLPMPAFGEIAIEGFIPSPTERLEPEGPFGEWTGYYAHGRQPELVLEVAAVYYRNDPIIFGLPPERPVGCNYMPNFGIDDYDFVRRLEKANIPGVERIVHVSRPNFRAIAIKQMYPGHVEDVIKVVEPGGDQYCGHNIWVLVDDDVDLDNQSELLWVLASRLAPERGVKVIPGTGVWQLDPLIPPNERSKPDAKGRKPYTAHNLVLNACRPYEWLEQFPPVAVNGPELRARVRDKWAHLFSKSNSDGSGRR
jgi:4-hydroxy-3-polyprenylbenzoate decarboxylase